MARKKVTRKKVVITKLGSQKIPLLGVKYNTFIPKIGKTEYLPIEICDYLVRNRLAVEVKSSK